MQPQSGLTPDLLGQLFVAIAAGASQHDSFLSLLPPALQYLGHVEVEESRGMHICEDAVKRLKTVSFSRTTRTSRNTVAGHQTSCFLVVFPVSSCSSFWATSV